MNLPSSIKKLADQLAEMPSIGPRQATRLIFYLIGKGKDAIFNLSQNINNLIKIKICERCFFIHQNSDNLCDICRNSKRNQSIIAIIEKETDLLSMENTGKFSGRYFILGGIPKTGNLEDWQKLRIQGLRNFIAKELGGKAEEIILAFNPTSLGDWHASLITKELSPFTEKISRLGRGLPFGGEIEFADDETLGNAIEKRN